MLEFILIHYLLICMICLILTKDVFHPSCIVSGLWTFLLFLYKVCDHPLWMLSNKFFLALSLWVVPFVLCSLWISKTNWQLPQKRRIFNLNKYNRYYFVALLFPLFFIMSFVSYGGGFSIAKTKAVVSGDMPPLINILLYLNSLMTAFVFYGILNYEKIGRTKILVLFISLLFMTVFKGNKTSFVSLFIGLFFMLKHKGKLRIRFVLLCIAVLSIFLVWVAVGRSDYNFEQESAVVNFFYIYFLSPLPSFDMILHSEWHLDPGSPMSATFSFFYKVINALGGNFKIAELGDWVYVPLQNNVFTTLRPFYIDGGFLWLTIMSCILGCIWGLLYKLQKQGNTVSIVFYAIMVSSLFYQSFDDYFFRDISLIIQYYLSIIFLVRGFKWKYTK